MKHKADQGEAAKLLKTHEFRCGSPEFKLQAKFSSRERGIPRHEALGQIAHDHGYRNWSLLMKNAALPMLEGAAKKYYRFSRTTDEMRQALRKVQLPRSSFLNPIEEAEKKMADISSEFGSALSAVDFAVDYMTRLLTVPRFKVPPGSDAYWEMRCWLPYQVGAINGEKQILLNRRYKPVCTIGNEWSVYEEHEHLHAHLDDEQLRMIAHRADSKGFLFADACTPRASRKNAQDYLLRLRKLQALLRGKAS